MKKRRIRTWPEIEESGGLATIPETAAHLRVSPPTVYSLIRKGVLPAVKLGDLATRIRPADVNELVERGVPEKPKVKIRRDYKPAPVREVG